MRLILFRHGIAEERRAGLDDAERRLTPAGIERTRLAARGLASVYDGIDRILTSPKRRALETAELLSEAAGRPIELCEPLAEDTVDEAINVLEGLDDHVPVLVGHEPMLSLLAEELCGANDAPFIELKKAGAVTLQVDNTQARGYLQALLPPRALRMIGAQIK